MKNLKYTIFIIALYFSLFSCANVNPQFETCIVDESYGFWAGLWHGIILPFSWIGSLFNDDIVMYACNNNGSWYDFGFILGLTSWTFNFNGNEQ